MDYIFKFKRERTEGGLTLRPKIKATLSFKEKARDVAVILDTGSDLNYMPKDFADYFQKCVENTFGLKCRRSRRISKPTKKVKKPSKQYVVNLQNLCET